jgi:hypothetical protein
MTAEKRQQIFRQLKEKLTLIDKKIDLIWLSDLTLMKNLSLNHHHDKDSIFLNFGECLIFDSLKIKLSASNTISHGQKFTEIGGALNNNEEAKALHKQFEKILGAADHFEESYGEIYTYWENEDNKIIIYPRHHMGGEWFEYKIMTKKTP